MIFEHLILDEWNPSVYITAYIPDVINISNSAQNKGSGLALRKAVLLCPGGGYLGINEQETEPSALQFLAAGYAVFVLHYSVGAGQAALPGPIAELSKAIALIRKNAPLWSLDPNGIHVCGFSTGAHLALLQASLWQTNWLSQMTGLPDQAMQPNGLILSYPLTDLKAFEAHLSAHLPEQLPLMDMINTALFNTPKPSAEKRSEWDCEKQLNSCVPPVFVWSLNNDRLMPENSIDALCQHLNTLSIKCESHCFEGGPHGSGLNFNGNFTERARFMDAVQNWML